MLKRSFLIIPVDGTNKSVARSSRERQVASFLLPLSVKEPEGPQSSATKPRLYAGSSVTSMRLEAPGARLAQDAARAMRVEGRPDLWGSERARSSVHYHAIVPRDPAPTPHPDPLPCLFCRGWHSQTLASKWGSFAFTHVSWITYLAPEAMLSRQPSPRSLSRALISAAVRFHPLPFSRGTSTLKMFTSFATTSLMIFKSSYFCGCPSKSGERRTSFARGFEIG